jgi:hypothetical protein
LEPIEEGWVLTFSPKGHDFVSVTAVKGRHRPMVFKSIADSTTGLL